MLITNMSNDTNVYYLFSNNYVNQLISVSSKQLDWGDEEVVAYYISFLKSLSLKLNGETIKFFYNYRDSFPLYTEAIAFL